MNANDIKKIIEELNEPMSLNDICLRYQQERKMIVSSNHRSEIINVLNTNKNIFYLTPDKKWAVITEETQRRSKEAKELVAKRIILFCNITYMKYYKGITKEDMPNVGGRFVKETGNAAEKNNFLPREDGTTWGFFNPGFTKGGYEVGNHKEIHIEKLDVSAEHKDKLNGVTVFMCAKRPNAPETVLVGWYDNATVYRYVSSGFNEEGQQWWKTLECKNEDAHLIEESMRTFKIPRASRDGIGFGQSNFWYADKEQDQELKEKAMEFIERIREYEQNR